MLYAVQFLKYNGDMPLHRQGHNYCSRVKRTTLVTTGRIWKHTCFLLVITTMMQCRELPSPTPHFFIFTGLNFGMVLRHKIFCAEKLNNYRLFQYQLIYLPYVKENFIPCYFLLFVRVFNLIVKVWLWPRGLSRCLCNCVNSVFQNPSVNLHLDFHSVRNTLH